MKILIIEPCFVGFGGYHRAYGIAMTLSKRGIKVDLLVSSNKNFALKIKKTEINENLRQYELPRINLNPYINMTGRILRGIIGLFFSFRKRYDIYHAFAPVQFESNIPAFFLKIVGRKVVIDWDDYWMGSPIFEEHTLTKKYVRFCEVKAPKFFENVVVVSDFLEEKAKKWGAKRILKLINGVNTSQFLVRSRNEGLEKLGLDKNKKYLLAFGNTFDTSRAYLLFKTFEEINDIDPNTYLLFNLDSKKIFKDLNLEKKINPNCLEKVIDVGYIQQEDLGYYLGVCEAVVFLQGETENEKACFPIRIGSYLNGETVIMMNDMNTEASNTLRKYDCSIIEKDISELARKTVDFLNNPELQKKLRNNVLGAKKNLSWENQIEDLICFYQKVTEEEGQYSWV